MTYPRPFMIDGSGTGTSHDLENTAVTEARDYSMTTRNENAVGIIRPDELYTLKEFTQRVGIRESALRSARRAGLRVCYAHNHGYVYGRDWIEYVLKSQDRRDNGSVERTGLD